MDKEMHGKKIESVWFQPDVNGQQLVVKSGDGIQLSMSATYHGDRDEFWIVESREVEGEMVEAARHNPRCVEGWEWDLDG